MYTLYCIFFFGGGGHLPQRGPFTSVKYGSGGLYSGVVNGPGTYFTGSVFNMTPLSHQYTFWNSALVSHFRNIFHITLICFSVRIFYVYVIYMYMDMLFSNIVIYMYHVYMHLLHIPFAINNLHYKTHLTQRCLFRKPAVRLLIELHTIYINQ